MQDDDLRAAERAIAAQDPEAALEALPSVLRIAAMVRERPATFHACAHPIEEVEHCEGYRCEPATGHSKVQMREMARCARCQKVVDPAEFCRCRCWPAHPSGEFLFEDQVFLGSGEHSERWCRDIQLRLREALSLLGACQQGAREAEPEFSRAAGDVHLALTGERPRRVRAPAALRRLIARVAAAHESWVGAASRERDIGRMTAISRHLARLRRLRERAELAWRESGGR